ncbi:hypothetical protein LH460_08670 [Laribacter hongkongensis]|uniref:hypothetical protein n=1 Tax=Laribacter hongkongensis TaxID=168471 RepID=UPI001EFC7BEC|nr:hypothetical protein [Laribacter hongkongensis]MCG9124748.1 hypothetical protein [Laribacter hongkongensis]
MNKKNKIITMTILAATGMIALSLLALHYQAEAQREAAIKEAEKIQKQKIEMIEKIKSPNTENIEKLRLIEKLQVLEPTIAAELKKPVLDDINKKVEENKVKTLQQEQQNRFNSKQIEKEEKRLKKQHGVSVGMTKQDVLDSNWGRPNHKTKYSSEQGTTEIWQYGAYGEQGALYFENGILKMIQN